LWGAKSLFRKRTGVANPKETRGAAKEKRKNPVKGPPGKSGGYRTYRGRKQDITSSILHKRERHRDDIKNPVKTLEKTKAAKRGRRGGRPKECTMYGLCTVPFYAVLLPSKH